MRGQLLLKVALSNRERDEDTIHNYNMKHVKSKGQRDNIMAGGGIIGSSIGAIRGFSGILGKSPGKAFRSVLGKGLAGAGAGLIAGFGVHKGIGKIWEAGGKKYLDKADDETLARTAKNMRNNDQDALNKHVLENGW